MLTLLEVQNLEKMPRDHFLIPEKSGYIAFKIETFCSWHNIFNHQELCVFVCVYVCVCDDILPLSIR